MRVETFANGTKPSWTVSDRINATVRVFDGVRFSRARLSFLSLPVQIEANSKMATALLRFYFDLLEPVSVFGRAFR